MGLADDLKDQLLQDIVKAVKGKSLLDLDWKWPKLEPPQFFDTKMEGDTFSTTLVMPVPVKTIQTTFVLQHQTKAKKGPPIHRKNPQWDV